MINSANSKKNIAIKMPIKIKKVKNEILLTPVSGDFTGGANSLNINKLISKDKTNISKFSNHSDKNVFKYSLLRIRKRMLMVRILLVLILIIQRMLKNLDLTQCTFHIYVIVRM